MSESPSKSHTADVSARKKVLLLGRFLGLASEDDYRASNASVAERAEFRNRKLASQYQSNLETIYTIAISNTPSDLTGTDLDPDWVHQFFILAEQIHNRNMQELWGRILAKEIVNPGYFSLRSLATLKQLTHKEAQLFEKALSMSVKIGDDPKLKLLIGYRHSGGIGQLFRKSNAVNMALSHFGLPYSSILTLVDAGLLHKSEFETGILNSKNPINFTLAGQQSTLTPKHGHLVLSYYRLTSTGDELAQLVKLKADDAYGKALKALFNKNFKIE
ncbi:TIGR03899 family protein [Shewanella sp. Isolate11]|uniref:TIGR03899 family protein n=1 Tax=Shewanella sp. Isolate11 TaxID=2908530 RepID=UPI001EFEDE60|nr:TIGR03899 family protein [Shewanella sp. Isolate11]MCG9697580.1 TIGR03899 family protein [Shewanella sp. Isolate11]